MSTSFLTQAGLRRAERESRRGKAILQSQCRAVGEDPADCRPFGRSAGMA